MWTLKQLLQLSLSDTEYIDPSGPAVELQLSGTPSEIPASINPGQPFNVMFPQYKGTVRELRFSNG